MGLSQGVQAHQAHLYLDLVKKVGLELRELLAAVDRLIPAFPSATHRYTQTNYFFMEFLNSRQCFCFNSRVQCGAD